MSNKFYHFNENNYLVLNSYDNIIDVEDYIHPDLFNKLKNIFDDDFILIRLIRSRVCRIDEDALTFDNILKCRMYMTCFDHIFKLLKTKYSWCTFVQFATEEQLLLAKVLLNV